MNEKAPRGDVTGAEAARLKGVSRQAIYSAIKDGRLPARKVGRVQLIPRAALEQWQPAYHRPKENQEQRTVAQLEEQLSSIKQQARQISRRVQAVFDREGGAMTLMALAEALGDEEDLMIHGIPAEIFADLISSVQDGLEEALLRPVEEDGPYYAIPINRIDEPFWKRADLCDRYEIIAFLISMRYAIGLHKPSMDRFLDAVGSRLPEYDGEFRAMVAQFRHDQRTRDEQARTQRAQREREAR